MLDEKQLPYRYREYTEDPLSEAEIREIFGLLGKRPRDLLRASGSHLSDLGLNGDESDDELIGQMARHPTLLQRPIGRLGERAAVGRPPENLLGLFVD